MADTPEEDVDVIDEQAEAELAAGYVTEAAPKAPAVAEAVAVAKPVAAQPPAAEAKAEAPAAAPQPTYAQVTVQELEDFRRAAVEAANLRNELSRIHGIVGSVKKDHESLAARMKAAPAGVTVDIPADAFAELEQGFPEVAALIRPAIEKSLKGIKGAPAAAATDLDAMQKVAHAEFVQRQVEVLDDSHPTWRADIGAPTDAAHPFRAWLAKQDAAYAKRVGETYSAAVIGRAIDRFKAETAPKPPPQAVTPPRIVARNDRIRSAVQPKGDGGLPPPSKTENDDFLDGWKTG